MEEKSPSNIYDESVEDYFRLKTEYDNKYKTKKRAIKNRDISLKEKRVLLRKIKIPCIHCKKRVGTQFTNTNGILRAVCGGTPPCELNIEIKKADTRYLPAVISNIQNIVRKIKKEIIETKLDFLFGLEKEKETISLFESFKEKFNKANAFLVNLEEIIQSTYAEKERKAEIETATLQLYLENEQFTNAIASYKETKNNTFLSDAIEIYIDKILILQERIQYNKYAEIYVDGEDKGGMIILDGEPPVAYALKAHPITIRQQEHEWEKGDVKHNLK